jgi:hypothetical protein
MRRSLVAWSEAEVPRSVLEARLARLQGLMRAARLDALVMYTNITRPAAATWLTQFVPYWSHGLLIVPASGTPTLIVALSKRVSGWIRSTSAVGEIISTPAIGATALKTIGALLPPAQHVGVVELDRLPIELARPLAAGLPAAALVEAGDLLARARAPSDWAEIGLAERATTIAQAALREARGQVHTGSASLIAAVDGAARRLGAEEVLIAVAPNLDSDIRLQRPEGDKPLGSRWGLRISLAYKGQWIRITRTLCTGDADRRAAAELQIWLGSTLPTISTGDDARAVLQARAFDLPGLDVTGCAWQGVRGGLPLASLDVPQPGSIVNADLQLSFRKRAWRLGETLHFAEAPHAPVCRLGGPE